MPKPPTTPELPPAGDARRDELKRRDDSLTEEAEVKAAAEDRHAIDPKVFRLENEIARHLDTLVVNDAQDEYAYRWVNFQSVGGIMVTRAQADGWEVVRGDMPEASERRDELGRRRVGDVILMRTPLDRKLELDRRDRALAKLQSESMEAALLEMGEKYANLGVRVTTELDERTLRRMQAQATAKQIAGRQFNSMLQRGAVPGLKPGS